MTICLHDYITILLYYYITILLYYYITILLYYYKTIYYITIVLYCYIAKFQYDCISIITIMKFLNNHKAAARATRQPTGPRGGPHPPKPKTNVFFLCFFSKV